MVLISNADAAGDWQLPGGTIEANETAQEALAREVAEEACARVIASVYLGCQEVLDPAAPHGRVRHFQTRFWAHVELDVWDPRFETIARRLVAPDDFLGTLYWGGAPTAPELLRLAVEEERRYRQRTTV